MEKLSELLPIIIAIPMVLIMILTIIRLIDFMHFMDGRPSIRNIRATYSADKESDNNFWYIYSIILGFALVTIILNT